MRFFTFLTFFILCFSVAGQNISLVRDLEPGSLGGSIDLLYAYENKAVFTFSPFASSATDVYGSDGSDENTFKLNIAVEDINIYPLSDFIDGGGGYIYFRQYHLGQHVCNIYRMRKTTMAVSKIASVETWTDFGGFEFFDSKLYYSIEKELFAIDLLSFETSLIKKFDKFDVIGIKKYNNQLYFLAGEASDRYGIYVSSDGSAGNIHEIKTFSNSSPIPSQQVSYIGLGNKLLFTMNLGPGQCGMFVTDGTADGTFKLIEMHGESFFNQRYAVLNNKAYFTGRKVDGEWNERFVFYTDGTVAGSGILDNSKITYNFVGFVPFDGKLYFTSDAGAIESDGTQAGTQLFSEAKAGTFATYNDSLFYTNTSGYLFAWKGGAAIQKKADGKFIKSYSKILPAEENCFFVGDNGDYGYELYVMKGSETNKLKEAVIENVRLYPNPAVASLSVAPDMVGAHVTITDMTGKLVRTEKQADSTIDIGNLASGTYFVLIRKSGRLYRSAFVKL